MEPLRVGVIGVGHLGRLHAKMLATIDGAHLAGVFDMDPAKAATVAAEFGTRAYGSLDELFAAARNHLAAAAYASNALPMETFLLAMMLEEHKEVLRLRNQVEKLLLELKKPDA